MARWILFVRPDYQLVCNSTKELASAILVGFQSPGRQIADVCDRALFHLIEQSELPQNKDSALECSTYMLLAGLARCAQMRVQRKSDV
jgi:hypothetical protein